MNVAHNFVLRLRNTLRDCCGIIRCTCGLVLRSLLMSNVDEKDIWSELGIEPCRKLFYREKDTQEWIEQYEDICVLLDQLGLAHGQ
jgi:hypothetical protein